jgi:hypothetical protein
MLLISIAALAFGLSFFFALGGVGSAVALVPALIAIGVPGGVARPVALLVNVASLGGATIHNIRNGKFKPGSWWPLIVFSLPAAPAGAWVSSRIPQDLLQGVFAFFMVFSGLLMILPVRQAREKERETCPPMGGALLGTASGLISGMLGVGGGGVIVPVLYAMGFRSQHIAMVTALTVPFSSLTGFIAYTAMGSLNLDVCLTVSAAALAGGMIGTRAMHRIDQGLVRLILALALMASGVRILWKMMG